MNEKEKIRERYKGIESDKTFVIPAKPKPSIYDDNVKRRVLEFVSGCKRTLSLIISYG